MSGGSIGWTLSWSWGTGCVVIWLCAVGNARIEVYGIKKGICNPTLARSQQ
jgi:hypothetical protein